MSRKRVPDHVPALVFPAALLQSYWLTGRLVILSFVWKRESCVHLGPFGTKMCSSMVSYHRLDVIHKGYLIV